MAELKQYDIYAASSWRNKYQENVVKKLRESGFSVYDFKNPEEKTVFHWSEIDSNWKDWNVSEINKALDHDLAQRAFESDYEALERSRYLVLVLPCGLSAHLEAGVFVGSGKPVFVFAPENIEVELMYIMFNHISDNLNKLIEHIKDYDKRWNSEPKDLPKSLSLYIKEMFNKP